jgi:alpha-N-acetylglucosamine transferase
MELASKPLPSKDWVGLKEVGWKRCVVDRIAPVNEAATYGPFRDQFTKLKLWRMTMYDKLVYFDCDTLVVKSIDSLLHTNLDGHAIGATRDIAGGKWLPTFNMGVFAIAPSEHEYRRLIQLKDSNAVKCDTQMAEQSWLNAVYKSEWIDIGFLNNANLAAYQWDRDKWMKHIDQVSGLQVQPVQPVQTVFEEVSGLQVQPVQPVQTVFEEVSGLQVQPVQTVYEEVSGLQVQPVQTV